MDQLSACNNFTHFIDIIKVNEQSGTALEESDEDDEEEKRDFFLF